MMKKDRLLGLDIIRTLAILFVFTTHSIFLLGVMNQEIFSLKWTIYVIMRFIASICVPLFLLLTGYLNNKKEISFNYYLGLIPVLISYVVISLIGTFIYSLNTGVDVNWVVSITKVLNFTENTYSWYVEMFIGLFLMIPFLNILYNNIKTKRDKKILICTFLFLTFIPRVVKSFHVLGSMFDISPDYWQIMYPITYYFIGAFIYEYKPKLNVLLNILLIIVCLIIPTVLCYVYSTPEEFAGFMMGGFEALPTAMVSVGVFLLLYNIDIKVQPLNFIFGEISICSFEMYLISNIADSYIYRNYTYSMPIMIFLVFISTYISARILRLVVLVPFSKWIIKELDNDHKESLMQKEKVKAENKILESVAK